MHHIERSKILTAAPVGLFASIIVLHLQHSENFAVFFIRVLSCKLVEMFHCAILRPIMLMCYDAKESYFFSLLWSPSFFPRKLLAEKEAKNGRLFLLPHSSMSSVLLSDFYWTELVKKGQSELCFKAIRKSSWPCPAGLHESFSPELLQHFPTTKKLCFPRVSSCLLESTHAYYIEY